MNKNLLSENMLRFGTKNLSERQERELIVKSIMETIDNNGLHGEIRSRLMEQADPPQNATVGIWSYQVNYKKALDKIGNPLKDKDDRDKILVYQTPNSMTEAKQILGTLISVIKNDDSEGTKTLATIGKINSKNYPAILWRVRYSPTFKQKVGSNHSSICAWLSNFIEASNQPGNPEYQTIGDLAATIWYKTTGFGVVGDKINNILYKFNSAEQIKGYSSGTQAYKAAEGNRR